MDQTAWNDSHVCQRSLCSPVPPTSGRHITIQGSGGGSLQRLSLGSFYCRPSIIHHITICRSYTRRDVEDFTQTDDQERPSYFNNVGGYGE